MPTTRRRSLFLATSLLLVAPACGGGDDDPRNGGDGGPVDGDGSPIGPDGGFTPPDAAVASNCDSEGEIVPEDEVDDGLDNDCDGLADEDTVCASGTADFTTINAAIEAAPAGGAIEVCPGTYDERLNINDKPVHLLGSGGADATIIDAGQGGRGLNVVGTGETGVIFEGFTITRGRVTGQPGGGVRCDGSTLVFKNSAVTLSVAEDGPGGGLYAQNCILAVEGSRFEGNRSTRGGGGAFVDQSSGEITGSQFIANRAGDSGGLAIVGGTMPVLDSEIRGNVAAVAAGGLHIESESLVEGNLILDNEAGWIGGGIYVHRHGPVIRGNTISGNASFNDGGGLYAYVSDIVVENNTVTNNSTDDDGGGLRIFSEVPPGADLGPLHCRLEANIVEGNHAGDSGGGIRVSHEPCHLIDNVVRGNDATNRGGGMDLDNDSSIVEGGLVEGNRAGSIGGGIASGLYPWLGGALSGITFRDNEADSGGALFIDYNFEPLALSGLIFENNRASRGAAIYTTASDVTLTHSVMRNNVATTGGAALHVASSLPYTDPEVCCPPVNPTVTVDFVVMHGNTAPTGSGVYVEVPGLSLENSIIAGNNGTAVRVTEDAIAAPPVWRFNDTFPAVFVGMADPTGTNGNISADPRFVDAAGGDYHLQATSPAKDAADPALLDADGSRADMGRHGGPSAP